MISKEWLYEEYVLKRTSQTEIISKLHIGYKRLVGLLIQYGFTIRNANEQHTMVNPHIEKENLKFLYEIKGLSTYEISNLTGISRRTILNRIKRYELSKHTKINHKEIIALYKSGKSMKWLSLHFQTTVDRIRPILRDNNIKIKSAYSYGNQISAPHSKMLIPLLEKYDINHITSFELPPIGKQYGNNTYEIDEYLIDYNIFLELNGEYWHGSEKAKQKQITKFNLIRQHYPHIKFVVIWEKQLYNGEAEKKIRELI